jgi:hypothetical protein
MSEWINETQNHAFLLNIYHNIIFVDLNGIYILSCTRFCYRLLFYNLNIKLPSDIFPIRVTFSFKSAIAVVYNVGCIVYVNITVHCWFHTCLDWKQIVGTDFDQPVMFSILLISYWFNLHHLPQLLSFIGRSMQ